MRRNKGKDNRNNQDKKLIFVEVGGKRKLWVNHFPANDSGKTLLQVPMSREMQNLVEKPGKINLPLLFEWIENRVLRYLGYQENTDFSTFKKVTRLVQQDKNLKKTVNLVVESVARTSRKPLKTRKYAAAA